MENLLLLILQSVVAPMSSVIAADQEEITQHIINKDDADEVLWLARILYSETKDVREMQDIAWVVRNRVETNFRGNSYQKVATSKSQFSGLNSFDKNYMHNISRTYESTGMAWEHALEVATDVFYAPADERPFSITVRHFYSPISVQAPTWTHTGDPVIERTDAKGNIRFAFYSGVK